MAAMFLALAGFSLKSSWFGLVSVGLGFYYKSSDCASLVASPRKETGCIYEISLFSRANCSVSVALRSEEACFSFFTAVWEVSHKSTEDGSKGSNGSG